MQQAFLMVISSKFLLPFSFERRTFPPFLSIISIDISDEIKKISEKTEIYGA